MALGLHDGCIRVGIIACWGGLATRIASERLAGGCSQAYGNEMEGLWTRGVESEDDENVSRDGEGVAEGGGEFVGVSG